MNIIVYENAVQRDCIKNTLKEIKGIPKNNSVFLKVSPYDIFSEYFNWFYTAIDDSYSFTGVRGIFYMKSDINFSSEDLVKSFFPESIPTDIQEYAACTGIKNWIRVFLQGLPAFTLFKRRKLKTYEYTIFFPGSPTRPIQENHPLKSLTMQWPKFEDCQFFRKDEVLISLLGSFAEVNQCNIEYYNNYINDFFLLKRKDNCFKTALKTYNSGYKVFTPEIYSIQVMKSQNINISYSLSNKFHYFSSKLVAEDFVRRVYLPKGTILRFLYTPGVFKIYRFEECHEFAGELWKYLDQKLSGSSYYQIAFDSESFELNTTLSYGHNTPREKFAVGKSQIYFYVNGAPVRIGIYTRDLILITVPPRISFEYKGRQINNLDLINIITDFCLSYL